MPIIVIAHEKGGCGKTTTSLNLVEVLKPDLIIDRDAHNNLSFINNIRSDDDQLNIVTPEHKADLIAALRQSEQGKLVFVDCGGFDSDLNRIAIASADLVITPANDDLPELIGLKHFNNTLAEISEEMNTHINTHVLWSRVHHSRTNFSDADSFLSNAQHLKRLTSTMPMRKIYPDTMKKHGLGVVAHTSSKYGAAARDMKALKTEITHLINT